MIILKPIRVLFCGLLLSTSLLNACELASSAEVKQLSAADLACVQQLYQGPINSWPAPQIDPNVEWQELAPLPEYAPAAADNPTTAAKVALGQRLFFDPQLSRNEDVSCASCHKPELGFSDGEKVSTGHMQRQGRRNSPSVVMSAFTHTPFWDGRTGSLEEQALKPIEDPVEMAFSVDELVVRLQASADYQHEFTQVFDQPVTAKGIAYALASYQRSLLPRDTDFERFMLGERDALNAQQIHGLHLFRTKGRCMHCHNGPALSDDQFHNLGLTYYGRQYEDLGRHEVTERPEDVGRFRTPSLRLVGQTGPWMHNGLFPYLWGVINMYNAGMPQPQRRTDQLDDNLFPQTSPLLKPLGLTAVERANLEAFLRGL